MEPKQDPGSLVAAARSSRRSNRSTGAGQPGAKGSTGSAAASPKIGVPGAKKGGPVSAVTSRATARVTAQTNDKAARLEKKGKSAGEVEKARAEDAKLNQRRVPIGDKANASKTKKAGSIVKGAVEGAAGKNTAGKLAGGQLTGAIAGAAQALLSVTKRRTTVIVLLVAMFPIMLNTAVPFVIAAIVIGAISGQSHAAATQASVTTSGLSPQATATIQQAAGKTITPWELMASTVYYETGAGSSVAQTKVSCPQNTHPGTLCPAVPAKTSSRTGPGLPPATLVHTGFTPKVGINGSVPAHLESTSADFVTTNTADWACIRDAESGDVYGIKSGAYGFVGTKTHPYTMSVYGVPGVSGPAASASPVDQNKVALVILHREGHFSGAWNDACTGSGGTTELPISAIPPGVPVPATPGTATSLGATPLSVATAKTTLPATSGTTPGTTTTTTTTSPTAVATTTTTTPKQASATTTPALQTQKCPAKSSGPYCLTTTSPHTRTSPPPLSTKQKTSLATSSSWVSDQVQTALNGKGVYGRIDLSAGVTVPNGKPPYLNRTAATAIQDRTYIMDALSTLPIAGNSSTLDTNVYELAVDWASGYAPPASTAACSPTSTKPAPPGPTAILGPSLLTAPETVGLTKNQVTMAYKIVTAAKSDGSSVTTEVALVAAALAASHLGAAVDPVHTHTGIFGTGSTTLTAAVKALAAKMAHTNSAPATQASKALGPSPLYYSGWIAGATQLVDLAIGTSAVCGGGVGSTQALVAIHAAEGELGLPYVYAGGGYTGPTLGSVTAGTGHGATPCANGHVVSTNGANGNVCTPAYAAQTGQPGFDCSGLTMFAWHVAGVNMVHNAAAQYTFVKSHGTIDTNIKTLQPGDLMFYSFTPGTVDHVAMYLGAGEEIQAPQTGEDVQVVPIYTTNFVGGGPP